MGQLFCALVTYREFGWPLPLTVHFNPDEDWYNPGFLEDVDNIGDITTAEIFSCLLNTTTSFEELIRQLKLKTINDGQVDIEFSNYSDWP